MTDAYREMMQRLVIACLGVALKTIREMEPSDAARRAYARRIGQALPDLVTDLAALLAGPR